MGGSLRAADRLVTSAAVTGIAFRLTEMERQAQGGSDGQASREYFVMLRRLIGRRAPNHSPCPA
jgi:hypothetical protein